MKALANAMPDNAPETLRSPKKLQYLLQGYLGTIGATALAMTDYAMRYTTDAPEQPSKRLQDMPVVGRFVRDGVNSSRYTRETYRMLKDANELASTIKQYREQGLYKQAETLETEERSKLMVRKNLNHYQQQISRLKKQQRRILESRIIRPEGKRKQIDLLTQQINQLSREAVQRYSTHF